MVIVAPLSWVWPAVVDCSTTCPSGAVPSTRRVSTLKPADSSVARAESTFWPTTPGTCSSSGPEPTVNLTG